MALTQAQKTGVIMKLSELAQEAASFNEHFNAFKEKYDAESYGTEITTGDINLTRLNGVTAAEWVDGVGALDTVSGSIETNKTNIYKVVE